MTKIPFVSKEKVEEIAANIRRRFIFIMMKKESGKMLKILKSIFFRNKGYKAVFRS